MRPLDCNLREYDVHVYLQFDNLFLKKPLVS